MRRLLVISVLVVLVLSVLLAGCGERAGQAFRGLTLEEKKEVLLEKGYTEEEIREILSAEGRQPKCEPKDVMDCSTSHQKVIIHISQTCEEQLEYQDCPFGCEMGECLPAPPMPPVNQTGNATGDNTNGTG